MSEEPHQILPNTDGAPTVTILDAVRHCANSWEGSARLLGNIRADDISRACSHALSIEDRYNSMETALVAIRCIYKNGPRNTTSWHDVDDMAAAALSIAVKDGHA